MYENKERETCTDTTLPNSRIAIPDAYTPSHRHSISYYAFATGSASERENACIAVSII